MNTAKLHSVLMSSAAKIQSAGSFSERIDVVYDIIDKTFPNTSVTAAIYGSIDSLMGFHSRTEIEPLLEVLKKSSQTGLEYVISDAELNDVLKSIYVIVKE